MQVDSINYLFISLINVFIIAFSIVCFSIFVVLSCTIKETDKLLRENHDSAVW